MSPLSHYPGPVICLSPPPNCEILWDRLLVLSISYHPEPALRLMHCIHQHVLRMKRCMDGSMVDTWIHGKVHDA